MLCNARMFFLLFLAVAVYFPLGAAAQLGGDRPSLGKTDSKGKSDSKQKTDSKDKDQVLDEMLLSTLTAREAKLAVVAEVRQIRIYHNKLKSGLGPDFFSSLTIIARDLYFKTIESELERL